MFCDFTESRTTTGEEGKVQDFNTRDMDGRRCHWTAYKTGTYRAFHRGHITGNAFLLKCKNQNLSLVATEYAMLTKSFYDDAIATARLLILALEHEKLSAQLGYSKAVDSRTQDVWDKLSQIMTGKAKKEAPQPLYFCCSQDCPGLPYKASEIQHPCK
jgi:hypothetical protein